MNAEVAPAITPLRPTRHHRIFHIGMAVAFLVTGLVGFAPTYFLKDFYHTPPLSPLLHVHGLVFTSWLLLLSLLFVVAAVIHDWKSRGRVHPLYIWGGLIVLLSGPVRSGIGHTVAWQSFARFLVE
jgi:MFS family permease